MADYSFKSIEDIMEYFDRKDMESLAEWFRSYDYPITLENTAESLTLKTDADRVPFSKVLRYPFTEEDLDDNLTGLLCVTDYAMHEGYDRTHSDLFKTLALKYAETHGFYEYKVNKNYIEYWSLYEDGFYFFRVDLNEGDREQVAHIEWLKQDGIPVPAFLVTELGSTKYNYFCG